MEVRFSNGEIDTLRLLGVDTPETFGENDPAEFEGISETAAGRDHLAEWGERATAFVTDELEGQEVRSKPILKPIDVVPTAGCWSISTPTARTSIES